MRRFWILFRTELQAWRRDPITVLGGFIAPLVLLVAFGALFGGRLTFEIALVNHDQGRLGAQLRRAFDQVISPFGTPYYDVLDLSEEEAWATYENLRIDGVWVIPADFSARVLAGQDPSVDMAFNNYNDDRAKNHRIYSAEILWAFYHDLGLPAPPLDLAETYPRPQMIDWFPIIACGVVLLSVMLGAMMNAFMLTHKEQLSGLTLEFGLAPRSLLWVLVPKILLALIMGLLTGLALLVVVWLWTGAWPGRYLAAAGLLAGLVALFWAALALLLGLRARYYMAGAVACILTGVLVFFIGGGLSMVRGNEQRVAWPAWLFPNIYAVDPLRDLVLFQAWPVDWQQTLAILSGFALLALAVSFLAASRQLRRLG